MAVADQMPDPVGVVLVDEMAAGVLPGGGLLVVPEDINKVAQVVGAIRAVPVAQKAAVHAKQTKAALKGRSFFYARLSSINDLTVEIKGMVSMGLKS
ncbi:hypothetical protein HK17_09270 [Acetobacter indonesiensis]|uniref:Uncharacterized protein n=1 Tax=Acetobacter indonesiensis TaxID=104101 RepID=A0A252ASD2_9PROT|nr:hypothetical protein HK17_09270 [Acetobacter indonesiensis]